MNDFVARFPNVTRVACKTAALCSSFLQSRASGLSGWRISACQRTENSRIGGCADDTLSLTVSASPNCSPGQYQRYLSVGMTDGLHHGAAKKKKLVRKCCIGDCTTRSPPDRLHCFPTEPQLRTEWMKLCRLKDGLKWPFICSRHFRPSLLPNKNSKLPKQALPELNLGTDTEDPLDLPLRNEAEDEGIDEDNSKGTDGAESCPSCQGTKDISVSLQQKLAAALLRIQELEQRLEDHADTEEEEYIFMLMK
ncbi:uncharacterized protein LOC117187158 isoform X2 [Drosophila miranda]|uniref:uncharacterized protein LOC117187158 isoform X2 n=1 Tax=Drosophila miranda TaxID=7229 RepID=UPI00143F7A14|nr:uncharacterized protein LOC117187158 isoform X2 [Drosophila miranda]